MVILTIAYWGLIPVIATCVTIKYGVNWPLLAILFLEFWIAGICWFSIGNRNNL